MSLVRAVVDEVDRQGVDVGEYLRAAGLSPARLDDPNARVEMPLYDRLQTLAIERTGDPALGLHMGEHAGMAAFSLVGLLTAQCRTLRECFDVMFRYYSIVGDVPRPRLEQAGEQVRLVYKIARSTPVCNRVRAEFGMTRLLLFGRTFIRPATQPDEVCFEHARPDYGQEYDRVFGGCARFDMGETSMTFPASWLDQEQRFGDAQVLNVLRQHADNALRALAPSARLSERVQLLMVHEYTTLRPEMGNVARRLGMSARSLRRRLTEEGTSFPDLAAEAMGQVARRALDEPGISIQEVAYRLGFAEVSSFHRAFKRWTGQTPKQYREAAALSPGNPQAG